MKHLFFIAFLFGFTQALVAYDKSYLDKCFSNVGEDVKRKSWAAQTFSGNECGITRFGQGITLNMKFSAYDSTKQKYTPYILDKLKEIAKKYGYDHYSIMILTCPPQFDPWFKLGYSFFQRSPGDEEAVYGRADCQDFGGGRAA